MNQEKKTMLFAVIAVTAAAVVWSIRWILDLIYDSSTEMTILNFICAAIWCCVSVWWIYKYRKQKKNDK